MAKFKYPMTDAMIKILHSWGWVFCGEHDPLKAKWYKYSNKILVARDKGKTWETDLAAAHLATVPAVDDVDLVALVGSRNIREKDGFFEIEVDRFDTLIAAVLALRERVRELEKAPAEAGEEDEDEVWEPTMELRRFRDGHTHILQQKWRRISGGPACGGGSTGWRAVPSVGPLFSHGANR